ncbi:hypothetical protein CesoFtcFv8_001444 [Champsocephalus esox]|uniref:Uncharacterized protein n=1 Tax=Champsocephalus esox TaxID=159716 RepID=A0AAN8HHX4_9TELE|nr:hypothetical protein CesoFtcFv8_001444 [Champsocephalus esox]
MPRVLRVARITEVERLAAANRHLSLSHTPPDQFGRSRRLVGVMALCTPPNRRTRNGLSSKVDRLAADRGMMKSPLGPSAWARCTPYTTPPPPSVGAPPSADAPPPVDGESSG